MEQLSTPLQNDSRSSDCLSTLGMCLRGGAFVSKTISQRSANLHFAVPPRLGFASDTTLELLIASSFRLQLCVDCESILVVS